MGDSGFTRGEIVDTPLSRWFVEMAGEHTWTSQHQAALYLGIKQPALNKWLRAKFMPSPYYQRILVEKTGKSRAFVEDLVERSRPYVGAQPPPSTETPELPDRAPTAAIVEMLRLMVKETLADAVHETLAQLLDSPANRDERSELIAVLVKGERVRRASTIEAERRRRAGGQGEGS